MCDRFAIVGKAGEAVRAVVDEQAAGRSLDDVDLARLSAALHAHINLNGRYHIDPDQPPRHLTPGRDSLATYQ